MRQEDKELLLQDLCGRIPYRVKMNHIANNEHSPNTLIGIAKDMITLEGPGGYECVDVEHYKPYLFPLSSMTEEQKTSHNFLKYSAHSNPIKLIDWYNKNHFDYRGLIPKGLAINCINLNIY